MRVVFDTNVYISGLQYGGKPEIALQAAAKEEFTLITSEAILAEIEQVLLTKFLWKGKATASLLGWLRTVCEVVTPRIIVTDCVDPDDNRILEAAIAGKADCIVSGDRHLLGMKSFHGIKIVTVNEFIERIESDRAVQ